MSTRTKLFKYAIAVLITVVLLAILSSYIQVAGIFQLLSGLPLHLVILAFLIYFVSTVLRMERFRSLLSLDLSRRRLFSIVCVHNLFNNFLPARTGELSFIYLIKKEGVRIGEGVATIIIARIFDMIFISLLFFISVLLVGPLPPLIHSIVLGAAIMLAFLVILLFLMVYCGTLFVTFFEKLFSLLGLKESKLANLMLEKGKEAADEFKALRSRHKALPVLVLSALIWFSQYSMYCVLIWAMGMNLGVWAAIIGVTLPVFSLVLPIQGVAGFGTIEGAWALAFISLGVQKELAVLTGFGFHILFLSYAIVLGAYGLLTLGKK